MTIQKAFNDIAVAQGGTAATEKTITAAIDALNDALAGSDQPKAQTIEQAVRLLGEHIGGGGANIGDLTTLPYSIDYEPTVGLGYDPENAIVVNAAGFSIGDKTVLPWQNNYNIEQAPINTTVTALAPFEMDFRGAYIVTIDLSGNTGIITTVEPVDMPISHSTGQFDDRAMDLYSWTVVENPDEYEQGVSARLLVVHINDR